VSPLQRTSPAVQKLAMHTPALQTGVVPEQAVSDFQCPVESQARGVEPTQSAVPDLHSSHSLPTASQSPAPQTFTGSNPVKLVLQTSRLSPLQRYSPAAQAPATQAPALQSGVDPVQAELAFQ